MIHKLANSRIQHRQTRKLETTDTTNNFRMQQFCRVLGHGHKFKINIINKRRRSKTVRGKKVKVQGYKKAIITLKKGQNIDLTTGI